MNNEERLHQSIIKGIKKTKAENIKSLNLSEVENSICNYFIICQAPSGNMAQSVVDSVEKQAKLDAEEKPIRIVGYTNAQWILLDYGNIIVHVFKDEFRDMYNLEDLWSDAKSETIENRSSSI